MKKKSLLILGLSFVLALAPVLTVHADDADPSATISALEEQKQSMLGEIDELEAQLVTTISEVNALNQKLDDLQVQINETTVELKAAQKDKETQHEAMKTRIQYVYENGGESGWVKVFLADGDISAWLNNNMTEDMYKYDRAQLEAYADACDKVLELQTKQNSEKADLEKQKNSLTEGQSRLEGLIAQAKDQYSAEDFDAKIAEAHAKAAEYQALIEQQNIAISAMVDEQIAAAADTAAEETYVDVSTDEAQEVIQEAAQQLADQMGTDIATATQAATQAYQATGSNGTASGAAILAYAQQFLGNPYVYGGNSLTNGIDCSGFVQQVYSNFGISTDRTSWDIENNGVEVAYNDVQIGDILCYDGHVGIYAGDGMIINAANDEQGITYTPANYTEIRTIRRVLDE